MTKLYHFDVFVFCRKQDKRVAEWSEKAEENRKTTADFQKKQREERKKLLAAGNLGGFNMNDMEEQLRQLEGAYTDSEEDYAEEEEE